VIYVGNANDSSGDQVLEEVMVGPVSIGINRFVLQANAPNPALIANQDLIGVTVILITCSFMDNKFVQIGYYVNNEYSEPFEPENFPNPVEINKLYRNILADQPRVTRYAIDWSGESSGAAAGLPAVGASSGDVAADEDEDVSVSLHALLLFVRCIGSMASVTFAASVFLFSYVTTTHLDATAYTHSRSWTWRGPTTRRTQRNPTVRMRAVTTKVLPCNMN
jgi:hypothetical protein